MLSVVVISFIVFFTSFFLFSFLGEDGGYTLFSPIINRLSSILDRLGGREGKVNVNVDLLSLISIGRGFFLDLLGFGIL